jgi:hypothetical protein
MASGFAEMTFEDFERSQWQQAIETFRVQIQLLVQWCSIMMIADVTLVGYAITQRTGITIAVGAIFPLTMVTMIRRFERHARPIIYTALTIEDANSEGVDGVATAYASSSAGPEYVECIRDAGRRATEAERMQALRSLPRRDLWGRRHLIPGLYTLAIGQMVASLLLVFVSGWKFA